jgi:hypothetical protein
MRRFSQIFQVLILLALHALPAVAYDPPALGVALLTPILPVFPGVFQEISITLDAPGVNSQDKFEARVTAESGYGVLLFPDAPDASGSITCRQGDPVSIKYRWSGALPTENIVTERITVTVPELNLSAYVEFSIGMDMQLVGLGVPESISSGEFTPVDIDIRDELNRDAPVDYILSTLGINPELKLELVSDMPSPRKETADLVVARFFGDLPKTEWETAYPGGEFKKGVIVKDADSPADIFSWRSLDGRGPEVSPPSPGTFRLTASLKPNTGGISLKAMTSQPFEVTGAVPASYGMSGVMASTVGILAAMNPEAAKIVAQTAKERLEAGDPNAAAALLGSCFASIPGASKLHNLGRFIDALLASGENVDSLVPFIENFLKGYGGCGVLIVTKSGVKQWSASVTENASFSSERHVVIPFGTGENFTLNVEGSGGGVSLWKIIPQGTNKKNYQAGDWEKEITVHTGRLTPP